MYILGINAYHAGASACLIRDGELIAAAEEERFRRIKYCAGFPSTAIRYCLAEGRISPRELDHVGISRDPRANLHKKFAFALRQRPRVGFVRDRLLNAARVQDPRSALAAALDVPAHQLRATFHNVEHHRAHMASAFYVSPFRRAAILSVDGMGDFVSTMWGVGQDDNLRVLGEVNFPHSLGIFYTAVCQWLGFRKYGDEGKVMGLAPYGQPRYVDLVHRIVRQHRDGTFELNQDAFVHQAGGANMTWNDGSPTLGTLYSPRFLELFGPARQPDPHGWRDLTTPENQYYVDVAASLQVVLEEAELGLVKNLQRITGEKALCVAGGVGLNSTFNGKIRLEAPGFEDVFVQPAASDAGTSLGVAYYIHHQLLRNPRKFVMSVAATGPAFDDATITQVIDHNGLDYERFDEDQLARLVAQLIEQGNVIGWFQDRMEWGPRALGNRSILADPRREDMKAILNARVKHRESFRPFAPSILAEATGDYFEQDYPDPFMTMVYTVRPEKRSVIPAVTHVDGTGRLQSVFQGAMPLYWQVIKEFESLTGVPVVLNTSFNDNEPIVCTPQEAVNCFLRTRMDVLVVGRHVVRKA
ncbi:MAG: carbamoyltransferase [Chloroflexi bacterium]|nr:carbamoyltransferase [Chloroflexota bacterium]MBV9595292.1 carbamoyltransferase [Chloroflexota bacterium]